MNRGIAKRTIFESRRDARIFLAILAHTVRRGYFEVHSYSVMATHFHLLVRSPSGQLSQGMQWLQDRYARWFNRSRRRDGSLFRGRFRSIPIESQNHWRAVVRYIDANPVEARVIPCSGDYPFGSGAHYKRLSGPPWLSRRKVEGWVQEEQGAKHYHPADYECVFGSSLEGGKKELVERRLALGKATGDPLDDIVGASSAAIQDWMIRKCKLADGTKPGVPVVGVKTVDASLAVVSNEPKCPVNRRIITRKYLRAGLYRHLCGLRLREISALLAISGATAGAWAREHQAAILREGIYSHTVSLITQRALLIEFPFRAKKVR
jgi:REP element-mobilizing transposase RayT